MENEIKEYLKHFGENLITKEIEDYAIEVALKHSRYIFTERRGKERYIYDPLTEERKRIGKQQYGYCTYCNKEYETEGLEHNGEIVCPGCGSKVKIKASGIGRKYLWDDAYFVTYEKSKIDKDVIVAKGIFVERSYKGDYRNLETYFDVKALYIFKINEPVMLTKSSWSREDRKYCWEKRQSIHSLFSQYPGRCYKSINSENIENVIGGTPYQYSMYKEYERYLGDNLKYFELFSKYPKIEDLTKLGFKNIVETKLYDGQTCSSINWNGKTVYKMLKVNKRELKELRSMERLISTCFLKLYQINKKQKSNLDIEQLKDLEREVERNFDRFKKINKTVSLRQIYSYMKKQEKLKKKSEKGHYYSFLSTWSDYLKDCKKLDLNMDDNQILCPKDLEDSHERTISQIKYQENERIDKGIKIVAERADKKYKFEDSKFIIRAIESTKELILEGSSLHHCVGGYATRYATGESNILAIRRKADIDKPYYTMEIKKDVIVQVRGKNNSGPDKELENFINKFKYERLSSSKNKLNKKLA